MCVRILRACTRTYSTLLEIASYLVAVHNAIIVTTQSPHNTLKYPCRETTRVDCSTAFISCLPSLHPKPPGRDLAHAADHLPPTEALLAPAASFFALLMPDDTWE
jgi:hypothetical protein